MLYKRNNFSPSDSMSSTYIEVIMKRKLILLLLALIVFFVIFSGCCGGSKETKVVTESSKITTTGQELQDLQKAKESGAISEKEYEETKKKILKE
jgi:PBP1b-binding outer membrane lipoprotein LpoB